MLSLPLLLEALHHLSTAVAGLADKSLTNSELVIFGWCKIPSFILSSVDLQCLSTPAAEDCPLSTGHSYCL